MEISIVADTRKLEDALYLLAKEARVEPGQVFREEAKLFVRSLWDNTPPASNAQGREAIRQDLFGGKKIRRTGGGTEASVGLFQKIGSSTEVPPRHEGTQTIGVRLGWEGSKTIRIMRKFWRPDASQGELEAFHKRYQNPKTGRTGHVSRSTIGRWRVQDQMWVKDSTANRYLRTLQARVGWTKAALGAAAMTAAGGKVPAWINRHAAAANAVTADFGESPKVFSQGFNVKIPGLQRMVDNALKFREKITERKINRLIAGKATNLGFVTILERK